MENIKNEHETIQRTMTIYSHATVIYEIYWVNEEGVERLNSLNRISN